MDILDIFYNHIVKEAANGRIDCYMFYNIIFKTYILEDNLFIDSKNDNNDLLIPLLNISDKQQFNQLLIEYVNLALSFYDDSNFIDEVLKKEEFIEKGICKEKVIMTLLFANATIEDFNDPIKFLRKRIDFLNDEKLLSLQEEKNLGYSEILNGDIFIKLEKDTINFETPYKLYIKLVNENNEIYEFPLIKLGISNNEAYIYAIQNEKNRNNDNNYAKLVNRILYKIGEGFNSKTDNYDIYDIGNLKDVTPSFLVATCIAVSILDNLGIDKVIIPSFLIERWNAKKISLEHIPKRIQDKVDYINIKSNEHIKIQTNLTDKLIRTFKRLDYRFSNIEILNEPYDIDSNLRFNLDHGSFICNNNLLQEVYNIGINYNYNCKHH